METIETDLLHFMELCITVATRSASATISLLVSLDVPYTAEVPFLTQLGHRAAAEVKNLVARLSTMQGIGNIQNHGSVMQQASLVHNNVRKWLPLQFVAYCTWAGIWLSPHFFRTEWMYSKYIAVGQLPWTAWIYLYSMHAHDAFNLCIITYTMW